MSLLPVEEARSRILADVTPLPADEVPLADADGRVLAEDLRASRDQPPFDASAMDGYAVRAADAAAGATLRRIGESIAGRRYDGSVGPGEAVRIFTGAPVPAGADAILIQENAREEGNAVTVLEAPLPGRFIRPRGLDFRAGDILLDAGRILGPRELALAAAANEGRLPVRRRPVVAFLSIGDELVAAGSQPGPDQIAASSAAGLVPLARRAGAAALDLGIVPDSVEELKTVAADAARDRVDVLVTLGGASVGEHDLVRPALTAIGMELDFWRIAMRPGRPMLYGRLGGTRVLGLPGNPVSSLVCSMLFLVPLIQALLGIPWRDPTVPALLAADVATNDGREDYVRARIVGHDGSGLPQVAPLPKQDSSMLRVLVEADCLLVRPVNAAAAARDERCRILPLF